MTTRYFTLFALSVLTATASAITPLEATDAILGRNGDRLMAEVTKNAKDTETLGIANAPDPEIEADYKVAPSGVENRWGVGIGYELEWPGVYGARRNAGAAMRNANAAEANAAIYAKRLEILSEIWSYIYADRRLDMMRKVAVSTDSIHAIAVRANRGGEMSRLDLSKIAIEQSRIRSIIAGIEAEKLSTEGNLQTLNGGQSCKALLASIDKDLHLTPLASLDSYLSTISKNPELMKAVSEFDVAQRNLSVVKSEVLPDFKIGYSHEFEDGTHFNGANLGVSIPIFSSRNKVKAAEAAKAAAEFQMTVATDKLESQVTSLYNEIIALDKALQTSDEIFNSTDYTTLLMKAYKGGELSLTDYLRELSWFYEAHLEHMDLQYQRESKAALLSIMH